MSKTIPTDIVDKIQQGNHTDQDVSDAVAEIIRLRRELAESIRKTEAEETIRELNDGRRE